MGGETPISGAVRLGTTTTGANGLFTFTTGYTCTAGQYVYITASGGDLSNGNNVINNQEVQIAALGSCSNFVGSAAPRPWSRSTSTRSRLLPPHTRWATL